MNHKHGKLEQLPFQNILSCEDSLGGSTSFWHISTVMELRVCDRELGDSLLTRRRLALNLTLTFHRRGLSFASWRVLVIRKIGAHLLETHSHIMTATAFQSGAGHPSFLMDNPYASSRLGPRTLQVRSLLFQDTRDSLRSYREERNDRCILSLAVGSMEGWHISRPRYQVRW